MFDAEDPTTGTLIFVHAIAIGIMDPRQETFGIIIGRYLINGMRYKYAVLLAATSHRPDGAVLDLWRTEFRRDM